MNMGMVTAAGERPTSLYFRACHHIGATAAGGDR
jgi:hypothetical protein